MHSRCSSCDTRGLAHQHAPHGRECTAEVNLVNLERVGFNLRNFDMVFIWKDLTRDVGRIDSIPSTSLDTIKVSRQAWGVLPTDWSRRALLQICASGCCTISTLGQLAAPKGATFGRALLWAPTGLADQH